MQHYFIRIVAEPELEPSKLAQAGIPSHSAKVPAVGDSVEEEFRAWA